MNPLVNYLLRLADSQLVLGQRLGEWAGHGPTLEEDIALTNVALDHVGSARLLYQYAGKLENKSEDDYAYWRNEREFLNYTICELPNSGIQKGQHARDYAFTIMRNVLYSAWMLALWTALCKSSDAELAAIAHKSVKEARYHLRHASDWLIKLGDGTAESHARMQAALNQLLPYTAEFFSADEVENELAQQGIVFTGASLQAAWIKATEDFFAQATLTLPKPSGFVSQGKLGIHSEHLGFLLAEMQSLARAHPKANW